MAAPFQFEFLLNLARDKREDALNHLRDATQNLEQSRQRLIQVEAYAQEYRNRLAEKVNQGITAPQYSDYQQFLARLDQAATQQGFDVQRCEQVLEATRRFWQETERELKAYETLQERHLRGEIVREERREQKMMDEWVSISIRNKR
ncbi:flagellar export protein FliJ [Burkholderiaceae bacterium DAT-1]|nr:flagellar export protein FliJ [Burkholderiaceae bacterium DAT-1]